jgi:hypothetical protein
MNTRGRKQTGFVAIFVVFLSLLGSSAARADEVAPDLEGADLRTRTQAELRKLVAALPASDQKRLTGVYVAFESSVSDPAAQVACDDDGDYVVVVSDAMLRLAAHVARASVYEETSGKGKVEMYASFVARSQIPGRRLLPPPHGFYTTMPEPSSYEEHLADTLAFIVSRELTHLRRGDLVCPKPTPTKERGDDVWTTAEQRSAIEVAKAVYSANRQTERDSEAVASVVDMGHGLQGGLALLRFFAQVELDSRDSPVVTPSRFCTSYAMLHPNAAARLAVVQQMPGSARGASF